MIQIIVLLGIMIYNTLKAWTVPESITTAYFMNLLLISGGAVLSVLTWLSQKNKTLIPVLSGIYSFWFLICICILTEDPTLIVGLQFILAGLGICVFRFLDPLWKWKAPAHPTFPLKPVPVCFGYTIVELAVMIVIGIQEKYEDYFVIPILAAFLIFVISSIAFLFLKNSVAANSIIVSQFLLYGLLNYNYTSINYIFVLVWLASEIVTILIFTFPKSSVFHTISIKSYQPET